MLPRTTFHKLLKEVGFTPKRQMTWLLKFASRDLRHCTREERVSLGNEIGLFVLLGLYGADFLKRYSAYEFNDLLRVRWFRVKELHQLTVQIIVSLVDEGLVRFPPITTRHTFYKYPSADLPKSVKVTPSSPFPWQNEFFQSAYDKQGKYIGPSYFQDRCLGDERDAFLHQFATLLEAMGDRLARCPTADCQKIFIKTSIRKCYCSPRCRSKTAMRQIRAKQKKESAYANKRNKKRTRHRST